MQNKNSFLADKVLLVVDDDPANRMTIVDLMLQQMPTMSVLVANHGKQALQIIAKKQVDVVLLDWEMPVLNGLETLQEIQRNNNWKNIPVIMYTGAMTASRNLEQALEQGAVDFLRKPADPIELLARIQSILYQKQLEQERIAIEKELLIAQQDFLQKEVKMIRQELNSNLLLLAHKNKVLLEIKGRCETETENPAILVRHVARHIDKLIVEDNYWEDFMEKFNKTDPLFIKNLLARTPNLSSNEVRVCSLIRFGMNNKDIMNIINISIEGIKKSRYRIRKKLSLETGTSLEKYLMNL